MNSAEYEYSLEIDDFAKSFESLKAVDGISFKMKPGEIIGLLGPNGAGKTTLLRMICNLIKRDRGSLSLLGKSVPGSGEHFKRNLGFSPQETVVWPDLTPLEQMVFMGSMYKVPMDESRRRGMDILEKLGLRDQCHIVTGKLSGGMKRRLNLALTLIHHPSVLVLDEPFTGFDPESRLMVRELLLHMAHSLGTSVLISSHIIDEIDRLADTVVIMDRGKFLAEGPPHTLKKNSGAARVVEIAVSGMNSEAVGKTMSFLKDSGVEGTLRGPEIFIRLNDSDDRMGIITGGLEEILGFKPELMTRDYSLEDLFVDLTGRRLNP